MAFVDADFNSFQPIEGVPLLMIYYGDHRTFLPLSPPVEEGKVSDNESYAIFKASKAAKLTVKTEGTGNVRKNPVVTLEEVEI